MTNKSLGAIENLYTLYLVKADAYAQQQVNLADEDQGGVDASISGLRVEEARFAACGFAWVKIKGIRKDAIKKALLDYGFTRSYPNGLELWIHKYGQSVDAKSSYAMHFAKFMKEQTGLPFTSGSRLD